MDNWRFLLGTVGKVWEVFGGQTVQLIRQRPRPGSPCCAISRSRNVRPARCSLFIHRACAVLRGMAMRISAAFVPKQKAGAAGIDQERTRSEFPLAAGLRRLPSLLLGVRLPFRGELRL